MGQWVSKKIPAPADDPPPDTAQSFLDSLNTNDMMKTVVMTGLEEVPEAGTALAALVGVLWPDSAAKTITWDQIAEGVKTICAGLIDEFAAKELRDQTEGLFTLIDSYHHTSYGIDQKGEKFTHILGWFDESQAKYMNQEHPWLTLQYFVPMATLNLTILREQWLFWDQIYPHDKGKDTEEHLTQLEKQRDKYILAATRIREKCLTWRMEQIRRTDWSSDTCNVVDDVRHINHQINRPSMDNVGRADAEVKAQMYYKNLLDYVDQVYRQQIEDLLAPSLQWPYFANVGEYPEIKRPITTTTGTMGSGLSHFMLYFDDREFREQNGPITRIELHGWSSVNGIEVFYGGVSSGLRGNGGGTVRVMDIEANEGIVKISGIMGQYLDGLSFFVSAQKHIGTGAGGGGGEPRQTPNFFMGSLPGEPLDFVGWQLRYMFGWHNPVMGHLEQLGAVFSHEEVVGKPAVDVRWPLTPPGFQPPFGADPAKWAPGIAGIAGIARIKHLDRQAREAVVENPTSLARYTE